MFIRSTITVVALVAATSASAATLPEIYSSFFVLGDSNSDPGNLGAAAPSPPYFDGQFSNGPVFAVQLQNGFDTDPDGGFNSGNIAFGGARATNSTTVPDLPLQLEVFLADLDPDVPDPLPGTPDVGERPLVSIWFGANDVRAAYEGYLADLAAIDPTLDVATQSAQREAAYEAATAVVEEAALSQAAAFATVSAVPGFDDFIAYSTANLARTPALLDDPSAETATDLTEAFNTAFVAALRGAIEREDRVTYVDTFDLLEDVIGSGGEGFGVNNLTDPCLSFFDDGPVVCDTPGTYLWWDEVHISGTANTILAEVVANSVLGGDTLTPIPLPPTLPLVAAGGLLLVGAARHRG